MFGINYKFWIRESINAKVKEYMNWLGISLCWDEIELGYVDSDHEKFLEFYEKDICNHPKRMYRPGNTVIMHFTPISQELMKKYRDGKMSETEWEKLCLDTRQLSRGITDAVTSTLQKYGREVSLLSEREQWSHACGAEVAGMGQFEFRDEIFHRGGQVGYLGAVTTEVVIK